MGLVKAKKVGVGTLATQNITGLGLFGILVFIDLGSILGNNPMTVIHSYVALSNPIRKLSVESWDWTALADSAKAVQDLHADSACKSWTY